jgi:Uri superfamily endonuclease
MEWKANWQNDSKDQEHSWPQDSRHLVLASASTARICVGRLGVLPLQPGHYVYDGSAFGPGGPRARIGHHQHRNEHPHRHIDYLRRHTRLVSVWYCCGARCEHSWSAQLRAIPGAAVPMPGFGSSDSSAVHYAYTYIFCPSKGKPLGFTAQDRARRAGPFCGSRPRCLRASAGRRWSCLRVKPLPPILRWGLSTTFTWTESACRSRSLLYKNHR